MAVGKTKVDWAQIKAEYITTRASYRELAQKYDLAEDTVCRIGRKEKWVEQRRKYVGNTSAKTVQKQASKNAARLSKLMDLTGETIDAAERALRDKKQFFRHIVTISEDKSSEQTERVFSKMDTKALKDVTAALKDLTALMRDFYDIPTPAQAEARRVAAARLKLEQAKADTDTHNNTAVEVIFDAGEEEWNA